MHHRPEGARTIRIMWWNCRFGSTADDIIRQIKLEHPDILFLFESQHTPDAGSQSVHDSIATTFSLSESQHRFVQSAKRGRRGLDGTSVFCFSPDLLCEQISHYHLSKGGRFGGKGPATRNLVEVGLWSETKQTVVRIGGIHASYGWPLFNRARLREELRETEFHIRNSNHPYLLGGDFNTPVMSVCGILKRSNGSRMLVPILPLEAKRVHSRHGFRMTVGSCSLLNVRSKHITRVIDFCLTHTDLVPAISSVRYRGFGPSNHRSLIVELSI